MALIPLSAGPLTMVFDPENGFLRRIRLGSQEFIRGIYGAVRDRNWDTVPGRIEGLCVQQNGDEFSVTFRDVCQFGGIHYVWHGSITGTKEGAVAFVFDGKAHSSFLKNRIGLCVLHPNRELAGRACTVQHVDGTVSESAFPAAISLKTLSD